GQSRPEHLNLCLDHPVTPGDDIRAPHHTRPFHALGGNAAPPLGGEGERRLRPLALDARAAAGSYSLVGAPGIALLIT
ncbi:hypothetical protein JXA88_16280, partial [Candidatus Fermentibacteria bacterium]|nr:hypothetical protein [Candidatus Fermentibacteria bacterium]